MKRFRDRAHAGKLLGRRLAHLKDRDDVIVLALPRGGVPVGFAVACSLDAKFDVYVVRKLGVPGNEELAMGAVAPDGTKSLNAAVIQELGITNEQIEDVLVQEMREIERRETAYRSGKGHVSVAGHCVVLVDDGIATGATMHVAVRALRTKQPASIVIATPVAPYEVCEELRPDVDEIVCLVTPDQFGGVGSWYYDFSPTSDDEVCALLAKAEGFGRYRSSPTDAWAKSRRSGMNDAGVCE
jgi:putative phosphoribosyl transferase